MLQDAILNNDKKWLTILMPYATIAVVSQPAFCSETILHTIAAQSPLPISVEDVSSPMFKCIHIHS